MQEYASHGVQDGCSWASGVLVKLFSFGVGEDMSVAEDVEASSVYYHA